jgi:D-alanyl-D-alanine carboxypeptidase (penicillin-binding protein 5/6)
VAAWLIALLATLSPSALAQRVPPPGEPPVNAFPRAAAGYLVAIDDRELWAKAPDQLRPPASLTKLLAALTLLGGRWEPDAIVTVSAQAAAAEGTRAGLRAGDRVRADELLTALLVASANDACLALAEHAAGSEARFVARMADAAALLGLADARFADACGLAATGSGASPRALLGLARAAMREPAIARRVALASATVRTVGGRRLTLATSNRLLGRVPGTVGIKTGFSRAAGKCLIAAVDYRGRRLWLVLLDAPNRWLVADGLLEAARGVVDQGL